VVEEIFGRLPDLTGAQLGRLEDELRRERQRRTSSPLRPQRPLPGLLVDTSPYVPDELFGLVRRKQAREATGRKPTYEPPFSSPFCKAVHARTAHFTRAG
jgi:hypothetical protein